MKPGARLQLDKWRFVLPAQAAEAIDKPGEDAPTETEICSQTLPSDLELPGNEIHVWSAGLDSLNPSSFADTLSDGERRRADRFQFDRDRRRFIVRRGLLRTILGGYLDTEPGRLSLAFEPRGKPVLTPSPDGQPLHFNVSHSNGLALFAINRHAPVGVDIEHIRPIAELDEIAVKFFSTRENALLRAVPPNRKLEAFFNGWTRKEACLKATGEGITDALPKIEVSLTPGQTAHVLSVGGDVREAARWFLHSLAPAADFVGALACRWRNRHPLREGASTPSRMSPLAVSQLQRIVHTKWRVANR